MGVALKLTLFVALAFVIFAVVVKDMRSLNTAAPWSDDPYDAFFSFAIFFVPLVAALSTVRLLLCRPAEPLPLERVVALVRGSRVILGTVGVTLAAAWLSVLVATGTLASVTGRLLVVGLVVETIATLAAIAALVVATSRLGPILESVSPRSDWLSDGVELARGWTVRLGPAAPAAGRLIELADRGIVAGIRRRPFLAAVIAASAFGAFVGIGALLEGDPSILVLLLFLVGAGGMLAFLVTAGAYLGLVRRETNAARPVPRALIHAVVAAAISLPVAVAFRDSLWWVVGSDAAGAGLDQLAALLIVISVATLLVVALGELLIGFRGSRPTR